MFILPRHWLFFLRIFMTRWNEAYISLFYCRICVKDSISEAINTICFTFLFHVELPFTIIQFLFNYTVGARESGLGVLKCLKELPDIILSLKDIFLSSYPKYVEFDDSWTVEWAILCDSNYPFEVSNMIWLHFFMYFVMLSSACAPPYLLLMQFCVFWHKKNVCITIFVSTC